MLSTIFTTLIVLIIIIEIKTYFIKASSTNKFYGGIKRFIEPSPTIPESIEDLSNKFKTEWFENPESKDYFFQEIKIKKSFNLLEPLSNAKVCTLDNSTVKMLNIETDSIEPFEYPICPNTLFIRSFYDDLFDTMLSTMDGANLIGSAGTSKSTFQFYCIYKLMKAVGKISPILYPIYSLY
jgi:hypothetical protein